MTEAEFLEALDAIDKKYAKAFDLQQREFEEVNNELSKRIIALFLAYKKDKDLGIYDIDISNIEAVRLHKLSAYDELRRISKRTDLDSATVAKMTKNAVDNSRFLLSIRGKDGVVRRYTAEHYANLYADAIKSREEVAKILNSGVRVGRIPFRGSTDACRLYEGKYVSMDGSQDTAVVDGREVRLLSLPRLLANRKDIFHPFCRHFSIERVN